MANRSCRPSNASTNASCTHNTLLKSQRFNVHNRQTAEDQQLFPVSNELSSEFIFQVRYDRIE